jgi:hypothetical protein
VLFPLLLPSSSHAIAAFARQYKTPCNTCHDPYPHRTEFGEAFRRNGYVWPGAAKEALTTGGAADILDVAGVMKDVPLSATGVFQYAYDKENENDHLQPSTIFQLHLGGSLKNTVGFFAHNLTGSGEAVGVYRGALDWVTDIPVDVRFGTLIPQTTLWKPNQSFTTPLLAPLDVTVGAAPSLGTAREGVELSSFVLPRLYLAVGACDRPNQNGDDYYAHLAYKLGGADFQGKEPEMDFENESIWDYLSLTFGGYGYFGRTQETDDRFYRAGGEVEGRYKQLALLFSMMQAANDNTDGFGLRVETFTWLTEADYYVNTDVTLSGRFEYLHVGNDPEGAHRSVLGAVNWTPSMQSFLIRLEGKWDRSENHENPVDITGMLTAEIHI